MELVDTQGVTVDAGEGVRKQRHVCVAQSPQRQLARPVDARVGATTIKYGLPREVSVPTSPDSAP